MGSSGCGERRKQHSALNPAHPLAARGMFAGGGPQLTIAWHFVGSLGGMRDAFSPHLFAGCSLLAPEQTARSSRSTIGSSSSSTKARGWGQGLEVGSRIGERGQGQDLIGWGLGSDWCGWNVSPLTSSTEAGRKGSRPERWSRLARGRSQKCVHWSTFLPLPLASLASPTLDCVGMDVGGAPQAIG